MGETVTEGAVVEATRTNAESAACNWMMEQFEIAGMEVARRTFLQAPIVTEIAPSNL